MAAIESIKYGTRKNECYRVYDNDLGFVDRTLKNVQYLTDKWQEIENQEIRRRKNGKVLSKMIMLFPNTWTQTEKEAAIGNFLEKKFQNRHNFTFCFHEGKSGEVKENSHGHLYYSERILTDPKLKKDPAMSKLGYIKDFSKDWLKVCSVEQKIDKSPRIAMKRWKDDPAGARTKKAESSNKQLEDVQLKLQHFDILLLRKKFQKRKLSKLFYKQIAQQNQEQELEIQRQFFLTR